MELSHLPEVLVLHLVRFEKVTQSGAKAFRKLDTKVCLQGLPASGPFPPALVCLQDGQGVPYSVRACMCP